MICPNCKYEHENWDKGKQGEEGEFYEIEKEFTMIRENQYHREEQRSIKGCPKCHILFMPEW
jgi:protein-arginine kinase activator protein McsA